jgi:protein-tyrosine phosphatase
MTTAPHVPGWIELAGAHNVRDLGGLPAATGAVRPRVLLRGDNLDAVTAEDIALLGERIGLRAVVDLRAPFENPRAADWFDRHGIGWLHEPLLDLTGLTDPSVRVENASRDYPKLYAKMLQLAGPGLARILDFLVSGPRTPALVHCAAGKDRTGVTVAVLLAAAGVAEDAITADYLATADRIGIVRAALARRPEYSHLRPRSGAADTRPPVDRGAILGVLTTLAATPGGAAGYLVANGATTAQLERWRDLLIEPS